MLSSTTSLRRILIMAITVDLGLWRSDICTGATDKHSITAIDAVESARNSPDVYDLGDV